MNNIEALHDALSTIAVQGKEFTQYLADLPSPDDTVTADDITCQKIPDAYHASHKRLAEAAARVLQLTTDPTEYLDQLAANNQILICIRWLVNLQVLPKIPLFGGIRYAKLATLAHVPEPQLKSVARMAITNGFLCEPEPGTIHHSDHSALLVKDANFMNWARWMTNYSVPTAYKFAEATKQWGSTEAKSETAFNLAMNMSDPFFDYLRRDTEVNTMFSGYMRNVASTAGISFTHLVDGYDWAKLRDGSTVVDVGGSGGHASLALAQRFPQLNFVVQDLPETIANAKKAMDSDSALSDSSIASRVKYMEHDFFKPEPMIDADIYLLRMIIHDWPDNEAVKILGHVKDALRKPGARILIMDTVLPQPGTIPVLQERQLRVRDLTMMQVFNAKERELEDWKMLLGKIGLEVVRVEQPSGSVMGILEVGLADDDATNAGYDHGTKDATNGTLHMLNGVNGTANEETTDHARATHNGTTNGVHSGNDARESVKKMHQSGNNLPVLIIGAGIGGLCLAQGLQKAGVDFRVLERDLSVTSRPQGYRLKLEADAADALRESLPTHVYEAFETSCAISTTGETDFDPISGSITKSRAGGGLAGQQGLRATYTVDRTVFRTILMTGIEDKIIFGKEIVSYEVDLAEHKIVAILNDRAIMEGSFLAGADGVRSVIRRKLLPDHKFVDTGAVCIYGKTPITPELQARYPAKGLRWMTVCTDHAPLIQSILIGDSPLTLLSEPIRFGAKSRSQMANLPEDYVYWVLIGRKEIFAANDAQSAKMAAVGFSADESSRLSLDLTKEWDHSLRSLFELQDVSQCSTLRVVSATPEAPAWKASSFVTILGDAIHAMSPCGGVGANTALRDAAELAKLIATSDKKAINAERVGAFEEDMRKRTFQSLMRSLAGSKKMFDQRSFHECEVLDT